MGIREVELDLFYQKALENGVRGGISLKKVMAMRIQRGKKDGEVYTVCFGYKNTTLAAIFYRDRGQRIDAKQAIIKIRTEISKYNKVWRFGNKEEQLEYAIMAAKRINQTQLSNLSGIMTKNIDKVLYEMGESYILRTEGSYCFEDLYVYCIENAVKGYLKAGS